MPVAGVPVNIGWPFGMAKSKPADADDLEEWALHHDDPRSKEGFGLFCEAIVHPDLTADELHNLWVKANALVGQRAPADYGEFLAYGYLQGRRDALQPQRSVNAGREAAGLPTHD